MAGGGDNNITITVDVNGSRVSGGIAGVVSELSKITSAAGVMHAGMQSQNTLTAVTWANMGQAILGNIGPLGQWIFTASNAFNLINDGIGFVSGIANAFTSAAETVIGFAESLGQIAWDGIQQGIDLLNQLSGALDAVTSTMQTAFAESAFQLNETTEKNFANWEFLWGGPNRGGGNIAQQLVQWTKQASLVMPYTRQDLMAAVTTLSAMPNQTPAGIEKDLQLLSDVASTQGRPGLTLQWAAMAAMRGSQGYSRMLLMDLNISKTQLAQFGYNEKDDTTFFPALEKYEKWKGEYGASATISTQTFWGAQTSFTDRIQNFLLSAGGWNNNASSIQGDVRKGSLFGVLKNDLMSVSAWMDANGPTLDKLANLADKLFGGVMGGATTAFGALFTSLQNSGIARDFFTGADNFGTWLNSPDTQHNLAMFGDVIGNIVAPGLRDIGTSAAALWQGFSGSGIGQDVLQTLRDLGAWLSDPGTQAGMKNLADNIGKIGGGGLQGALSGLKGLLDGLQTSGLGGAASGNLTDFAQWISNPATLVQIRELAVLTGETIGDTLGLIGGMGELAISTIKTLATLLVDLGTLINDTVTGHVLALGGDWKQLVTDFQQGQQDMKNAQGDMFQAWMNIVYQANMTPQQAAALLGLGPGTPPSLPSKGAGAKWLQQHGGHLHSMSFGADITNALAAAASPGGPNAGTTAGQAFATQYVAAAQQTFQQRQTGGALVQTLTDGINQQLQRGGGDTLTATLAQFIDQRTRQMIAEMLAGYDLTSNRVGRQVGGFRNGPALGF